MDTPLEERDLPPPIWIVHVWKPDVARATVVRSEDDEGVVFESVRPQSVEYLTDAPIQRADHRRIDPFAVQFDMRKSVVVGLSRLERGVRRPMRKVEEERTVLVLFDDLDGFFAVVVGQVLRRLEGGPAVERRGKLECTPEKFIDRVEVLHGVDDAWIVLGKIESARHQEALVETLIFSCHSVHAAEMPLADVDCVVVLLLQQLRDRPLGSRHAHLFVGKRVTPRIRDRRPQSARHLCRDHSHRGPHSGRRGSELESKPGSVATRHDGRTRRCAGPIRGITIPEADSVVGE